MNNSPSTPPNTRQLGGGMIFLAWLVIILLLAGYFWHQQAEKENPNRQPKMIFKDGSEQLVLTANFAHHFVLNGKINGKKVTMLLDTGATNVSIPADMAQSLNLKKGRPIIVSTANGLTEAFNTKIDTLQLGNFILYDVAATISPGMNNMKQILLGMSALSHFELRQSNGTMTLQLKDYQQ